MHAAAPDEVGPIREEDDGDRENNRSRLQQAERHRQRKLQITCSVRDEVNDDEISRRANRQITACSQKHSSRFVAQHIENRCSTRRSRAEDFRKDRAFGDSETYEQANYHERAAGEKRHTPSPRGELGGTDDCGGNQKYEVRENDTSGQSECDEASEKATPSLWCMVCLQRKSVHRRRPYEILAFRPAARRCRSITRSSAAWLMSSA